MCPVMLRLVAQQWVVNVSELTIVNRPISLQIISTVGSWDYSKTTSIVSTKWTSTDGSSSKYFNKELSSQWKRDKALLA